MPDCRVQLKSTRWMNANQVKKPKSRSNFMIISQCRCNLDVTYLSINTLVEVIQLLPLQGSLQGLMRGLLQRKACV